MMMMITINSDRIKENKIQACIWWHFTLKEKRSWGYFKGARDFEVIIIDPFF